MKSQIEMMLVNVCVIFVILMIITENESNSHHSHHKAHGKSNFISYYFSFEQ